VCRSHDVAGGRERVELRNSFGGTQAGQPSRYGRKVASPSQVLYEAMHPAPQPEDKHGVHGQNCDQKERRD